MRPGQAPSKAIGAHMIVVALFFAVVLLFCIPIVAWKLIVSAVVVAVCWASCAYAQV